MIATEKEVEVNQTIAISLDEDAFTPEFMEEFRGSFFDFDTIDEHREHLAQLYARGIIDDSTDFIEGYGAPKPFGIKFREIGMDVEIAS